MQLRQNSIYYGAKGTSTIAPQPGVKRWSDPATWGGTLPIAGQPVTIAVSDKILFDVSSPNLGKVTNYGTLIVDDGRDTQLQCAAFENWGTYSAGTSSIPLPTKHTLLLTGARPTHIVRDPAQGGGFINDGMSRSLMNMPGGIVTLYGANKLRKSPLAANAAAGATTLTLRVPVSWKQGDWICIPTTDFYAQNGTNGTEFHQVAADTFNSTTVTLTEQLAYAHYGQIQYVSESSPKVGALTTTDLGWRPDWPNTRYILDEAAVVINLSSNVQIMGANDAAWTNPVNNAVESTRGGFGAHTMAMGNTSTFILQNVELRRVGQAGSIGRYPVHFHMQAFGGQVGGDLNTDSDGSFIGSSPNHKVINCAIWQSQNRAVTIHGTWGTTVQDNAIADIVGHALFFEDGSEKFNILDGNVVYKVRSPYYGNTINRPTGDTTSQISLSLKLHDRVKPGSLTSGSAGIWFAAPENYVRNNRIADAQIGIWNAFSETNGYNAYGCFGFSKNVPYIPGFHVPLQHDNNTYHSIRFKGMITGARMVSETGQTDASLKYTPTLDGTGTDQEGANAATPVISNLTAFKCQVGAYQNVVANPLYLQWMIADNQGAGLNGAVNIGNFKGGCCIHVSNNNALGRVTTADGLTLATIDHAMVDYHGTLAVSETIGYGFQISTLEYNANDPSAIFRPVLSACSFFGGWTEYLSPFEPWPLRSTMKLLSCDWGFRTPGTCIMSDAPYNGPLSSATKRNSMSGAFLEPNGLVHQNGATGTYWILPIPFLTFGAANLLEALPLGHLNGYTTTTRYGGIQQHLSDNPAMTTGAGTVYLGRWKATRLNPADLSPVGVYEIAATVANGNFGFKHAALMNGGWYALSVDTYTPQSIRQTSVVDGMWRSDDTFVMRFDWAGSVPVQVFTANAGGDNNSTNIALNYAKQFTSVSSLSALQASFGWTFFQDVANNYVWVYYRGGLTWPIPSQIADGTGDRYYFQQVNLKLLPA